MAKLAPIRIGTSGWIYKQWREIFYPPKLPASRWFGFYAQHFDTVEINNSFYRLPSPEAFDAWQQQAPPGFLYAVKASRYLTHLKKLKDPEAPLQNVLERARRLGPVLGPLLYQLPPHWGCDPERLRHFLTLLPADLQHVVEFRDPSWYTEEVHEMLGKAGVGFCIHDMRGSVSPLWVTGPLAYLRFHGATGVRYAGRYGQAGLKPWAERIAEIRRQTGAVYVYFNNDGGGHALKDARDLKKLLESGES